MRAQLSVSKQAELESITNASKHAGFTELSLITCTALGALYTGMEHLCKTKNLIKASNIDLFLRQRVSYKQCKVDIAPPDALNEISILKYLSNSKHSPRSIPKFVDTFKSESHYFLITEYEGHSLFDFVLRAHQLIKADALQICEWHRVVRPIFKQMLECVAFMHSKNVCHFDLSLENFSINDIGISIKDTANTRDRTIQFEIDIDELDNSKHHSNTQLVQIKLIDFSFAEHFASASRPTFDGETSVECTPFQSNKYCGKPHYMSPEMANKRSISCFNAKSHDVWCLGVCLFVMCVGNAPFVHAKKDDVNFAHIMDGDLLFLLKKWNKLHFINPGIYEILEACLQYETYRISTTDLMRSPWISTR